MEEYPAFTLDHNVPLLTILGVTSSSKYDDGLDATLKSQAILLKSEPPVLESDQAKALLQYIQERDASTLPWNAREGPRKYIFRVRAAGRTILLPPRRVRLPVNFDPPAAPVTLHSPFSPLSPACHLYPDGIIDSAWLRKHQDQVPSVLLSFYSLTADPTLATLHDNQIKTDISNIRSFLSQSGYKTRVAVVLLSDQTTPSVEGIQERLESIRRGSGIDPKAFFFVPPQDSDEELGRIAENTLTNIYTHAMEYYRDLGRHARKKRTRGIAPQPVVPPTTGTSQTLSLAGWNIRYDFKSAVFAEYRQEMEIALRSYEQAYETVIGPEIMEQVPSWSPRWNQSRMLADNITVRAIRCLTWNGQYSAAARRWQAHRDKMADLVDRRGRGTNNYGWEAWEARWATVMAEIIERTQIPELDPASGLLFLQPEKGIMGERLQPWELLHHMGYWHRVAAKHLYARRTYAHALPVEDRRSPSSSPASRVASRAFTYDTFMSLDPHEEYPLENGGVDHTRLIIDTLLKARAEFEKRSQLRLVAELSLECATELGSIGDWINVVELLRPLWQDSTFRAEGWVTLVEDLTWTLRDAAQSTGQAGLLVAANWELLNRNFAKRPQGQYDISRSLEGLTVKEKPSIQTSDDSVLPFLSTSFIFQSDAAEAGSTCKAQLSITSCAHQDSAPVVLTSLRVDFDGALKSLTLVHNPGDQIKKAQSGSVILSSVQLIEAAPEQPESESLPEHDGTERLPLRGEADLTLVPGHTMVFELDITLREPGDATAASLLLSLHEEDFELDHLSNLKSSTTPDDWHISAAARKRVARANTRSLHILPRPPKMAIKQLNLMSQYYTSEAMELQFEILNAEDVDAVVKLDVMLFGEDPPSFKLQSVAENTNQVTREDGESKLIGASIGSLAASKSTTVTVIIDSINHPTRYDLEMKTLYHLASDPATLITQTAVFALNIVNPFEANYDLLPRLHPDAWPSLFNPEDVDDLSDDAKTAKLPRGLSQTWTLLTRYASFAAEDLKVTDLDIQVRTSQNVQCRSTKRRTLPEDGLQVSPKTIEEAAFDVVAQKVSLDDRGLASLDVSFVIKWTRLAEGAHANTTILPVPRFNIFGTEPRVLASVSYPKAPSELVILDVVIENASNHFLTFGLAMEPSDDFAFSGSKQTTLHLLPVSRRSVTYRLLPYARGEWIKPTLVVRDKYFQKVLRVIPTEGMKLDKDGFLIWVPPENSEA